MFGCGLLAGYLGCADPTDGLAVQDVGAPEVGSGTPPIVDCSADQPRNACGGCQTLSVSIGERCVPTESQPPGACPNPVWRCDERDTGQAVCEWVEASAEVCDGLDNDCDRAIDEDMDAPCDNACGAGVLECRNGQFPACAATSDDGQVCIDIRLFCETIPIELDLPLPTRQELGWMWSFCSTAASALTMIWPPFKHAPTNS